MDHPYSSTKLSMGYSYLIKLWIHIAAQSVKNNLVLQKKIVDSWAETSKSDQKT